MKNYWLMKSEPGAYSIDDLEKDTVTFWDGVRNFQARNFMRDTMQQGDLVLFYHSNAKPPGVAGIAKVVKTGYPDSTALDKKNKHFDPKSSKEKPIWYMVDIAFVKKLKRLISLDELKKNPDLKNMILLKRSRLSVQPVTKQEFEAIIAMESL
ncbi:MAG: EVE domain-containing protein [Chlamydiae bacterium CG10_big_fil_rev_8_21_14_0_10_35_9]|nr:MAG: EVE domain-containing protein [Chlamydiae bacterium CG10_big_fil_rev_8_21_14_0_10_35_9]